LTKEIISTKDAPQAIGPYSQAVKAGNFLFLSGNIGFDPQTMKIVSEDIVAQTRQVLENMKAVLAAAGATFRDVVKVTVYLSDWADFPAMNQVYAEYFTGDCPARATVQIAGLAPGAKLEVDAIAFLP